MEVEEIRYGLNFVLTALLNLEMYFQQILEKYLLKLVKKIQ